MKGSHIRFVAVTTVSLTALALFPGAAHAGGFYLQEQSVKAAGRAFSGEVADEGADSLWWNPAAIADIEQNEVYIGISTILPSAKVRDNGTVIVRPGQPAAPVGGNPLAKDPIETGILPSSAVAIRLTDRLVAGLAVSAPYSFTTNYDADSWVRYTADKSKLRTIDIQPSLAIAATDWLRLGVAANIEYSDATLTNALPNLVAALPDGEQRLEGDGWDLGWSAGAQVHTGPMTLGVSYKSSIKHTLAGRVETSGLLGPLAPANGTIDADAAFRTPWQFIMGGRFKASDKLTLNAQVVRIGWSEFDAIRLGDPINQAIPENYRNTWSFAGGLDYDVSPEWTVRAGVQHDQTPTRDGERDARVPDSDRWNFAGGTSYDVSKRFTIDAAVNYVSFKDASIDRVTAAYAGTAAQTPIIVDGRLEDTSAIVLAIGGRFRF